MGMPKRPVSDRLKDEPTRLRDIEGQSAFESEIQSDAKADHMYVQSNLAYLPTCSLSRSNQVAKAQDGMTP